MFRDRISHISSTIVLVFLFAVCSTVSAAGGGGGIEDEERNLTGYVAIGVAVLVAGFLIYDAISDNSDGNTNDDTTDAVNPVIVDTGIDWEAVESEDVPQAIELVVAVFPGESGFEQAAEVIGIISDESDDIWLAVYPDPIELGYGSAVESALLAESYFNADYLLLVEQTDDGYMIVLADSDSAVWSVSSAERPTSSEIAGAFLQRWTGDRRN